MLSADGNLVFHFLNVLICCGKAEPLGAGGWLRLQQLDCRTRLDCTLQRAQQVAAKPQLSHGHPGLFVSRALGSPS